uniref:Uncharacterized protein n=1 Tax=Arion vulgaris TaxID=1028688 RepID=A0A0B6ZDM2_9EUPU
MKLNCPVSSLSIVMSSAHMQEEVKCAYEKSQKWTNRSLSQCIAVTRAINVIHFL